MPSPRSASGATRPTTASGTWRSRSATTAPPPHRPVSTRRDGATRTTTAPPPRRRPALRRGSGSARTATGTISPDPATRQRASTTPRATAPGSLRPTPPRRGGWRSGRRRPPGGTRTPTTRDPGNPPTPPPASPVPGCFNNTLCHEDVQTAPHPVRPYADHPADAQAQFNTFCNDCHNMDLPRILVNAPYCIECHKGGSPFTFSRCASCHGNPPAGAAPVGAVFPNIAGAHAKHNALDNVQGVCNTCHNGGGTGTGLQHFYDNVGGASGIDVAFPNLLFKANSGNLLFTRSDHNCSNVSCHGGITTPGWRAALPATGDAACRLCHTAGAALGSPENNSPYSGLHIFHLATSVGGAVLCTECHNMANGTTGALNHFEFLNTAPMEGLEVV